jgi:hypothetical protein
MGQFNIGISKTPDSNLNRATQVDTAALVKQTREAANEVVKALNEFMADVQNSTKDLSNELGGRVAIQKKDAGDIKKEKELQKTKEAPASEAAAATSASEELERKKRKKRKKFEEKLEEFSALIDQVDIEKLPEDQKKEFELYEKNKKELRQLFRRLDGLDKQIESEERHLNQLTKKQTSE